MTKFKITPEQWAVWLADPCTGRLLEVLDLEIEQHQGIVAGARKLAAAAFPTRMDDVAAAAREAIESQGCARALVGIKGAILGAPNADRNLAAEEARVNAGREASS